MPPGLRHSLLDAASVSRQHAHIILVDGKYYIEEPSAAATAPCSTASRCGDERLRRHNQLGICDLVFIFHHGPPDLELPVARRLDETAEADGHADRQQKCAAKGNQ